MKVIKEVSAMQDISDYFRCMGKKIALVPTMGFLHAGHTSLMVKAKDENDILVVSIFVNPLQFGVGEDFDKYPRDFMRDFHICEKSLADYIFNPDADEMYKKNNYTTVNVANLSETLEGAFRPGHFTGVATVVNKLLNAVKPHRLYLGQKDAQQNAVIKKMTADLNIDTEVVVCETMRESNGLAMSSRNTYLSEHEKEKASALYFILNEGKRMLLEGTEPDPNRIKKYVKSVLKEKAPEIDLQYYEITDNKELMPVGDTMNFEGEVLISLAAKVGDTRLIDNIIFNKSKI